MYYEAEVSTWVGKNMHVSFIKIYTFDMDKGPQANHEGTKVCFLFYKLSGSLRF